MIRSNIGNVGTNAIQTMAISATTGAGMKRASLDRQLNNRLSGNENLLVDEQKLIGQASAKRRLDAAKEELGLSNEEGGESVDTIMSDVKSNIGKFKSLQTDNLFEKIFGSTEYIMMRGEKGQFRKTFVKDLKNKIEGGE